MVLVDDGDDGVVAEMTIEIVEGDCLDLAPADVAHFHTAIFDPPYRAHVHRSAVSQSAKRGVRQRDLGFAHLSPKLRRHLARLAAAVQGWALIYSDIESLTWWRISCEAAGTQYVRPLPWIRWSMPQLSGDRPPTLWEAISIFHRKGRKHYDGPGNFDAIPYIDHKCLRSEDKHGAEKPLDQALDLVDWYSQEGQDVFDACAGAGTVGLACKILGRGYFGIEKSPKWAALARERVEACQVLGPGVVAGGLSPRDSERYSRWLTARKAP